MHRKETAATYFETEHITQLLSMLTTFVQSRCHQVPASTESCTALLNLSIANKLCELCLYSRHHNYISDDLKPDGVMWALNAYDLTLEDQASVSTIKLLLDFMIKNKTEEDEGVKPATPSAFKLGAKMTQLCQKLGFILSVVGQTKQNSLVCLPALMELQASLDREIHGLVSEKKILDLRGF